MSNKHAHVPFFVCMHEQVPSTQDELKKLLRRSVNVPEWAVIFAKEQTHGRGRGGHRWHAEKNKNALFSVLVRPEFPADRFHLLYQISAVAVAEVLHANGIKDVSIKYPNDILIDGKKVAGILAENRIRKDKIVESIIGIGLNVNQVQFPDGISATSILQYTGKESDPLAWVHKIIAKMQKLFSIHAEEILKKYIYFWNSIGEKQGVIYENNFYPGTFLKLQNDLLFMQLTGGDIRSFPVKQIKPFA